MGFFYSASKKHAKAKPSSSIKKKHIPIKVLNQSRCESCSLNDCEDYIQTPKMRAWGSTKPSMYFIGEAPTKKDDRNGEPFSGRTGDMVLDALPKSYRTKVRAHNTIRCHTTEPITVREIESCRLHIIEDIEATKPKMVIALGNEALIWATKITGGISAWSGHIFPVRFGKHICWFMAVFSPAFLQQKEGRYGPSEWELVFEKDLKTAVKFLESNSRKLELIEDGYAENIEIILGKGRSDLDLLKERLEYYKTFQNVAFDWETDALRPYNKKTRILSLSISVYDETLAFPVEHPDGWSSNYREAVKDLVWDFLLNSGTKIAHNISFESEWIAEKFCPRLLRLTSYADTFAMSHTMDERKGIHSLGDLTMRLYGFDVKAQSKVKPENWKQYSLESLLIYNGMDSKYTFKSYQDMLPTIINTPNYEKEYLRKIRVILTAVLSQRRGVLVDLDFAEEIKLKLDADVEKLEQKIKDDKSVQKFQRLFGKTFEPGSPKHVSDLLKSVLKRKEGEVYDDGGNYLKYKADEDVLSLLPPDEVPVAKPILDLRAANKLLSTYVDPIIEGTIVYDDGRIHTNYNIMFTSTGRSSSSNPNMQNFPKQKYKEVRGVVVPHGYFLSVDYGQIEARVIAMASQDDAFVTSLWEGLDVHKAWALHFAEADPTWADRVNIVFSCKDDEVKIKSQMRQEVKNKWVFPQFFGASIRSCSANLNIELDICEEISEMFWLEFGGVKEWQDTIIKLYKKNLYVETLTGRKRRRILTKNEIINTGIQGTASDIVTRAWCELSEYAMETENDDYQANLNIHDDLTFELIPQNQEKDVQVISKIMTRPAFDFINVPLVVEVSVGDRWNTSKEIAKYSSQQLWGHTREDRFTNSL